MDFRIDELNQGLSLGLIVTVFTGMYLFASSIYVLENLELISSMSFSDDKWLFQSNWSIICRIGFDTLLKQSNNYSRFPHMWESTSL